MSFSSYSLTPALNVNIGAVSIGEGCPAGNLNDALRQIAADGKELANTVAGLNVSGFMPLTGGGFTGPITRSGSGGYLYHAGATQTTGPVYFLPNGSALPTPVEGAIVFFYS